MALQAAVANRSHWQGRWGSVGAAVSEEGAAAPVDTEVTGTTAWGGELASYTEQMQHEYTRDTDTACLKTRAESHLCRERCYSAYRTFNSRSQSRA